jgi:hypothetical protein
VINYATALGSESSTVSETIACVIPEMTVNKIPLDRLAMSVITKLRPNIDNLACIQTERLFSQFGLSRLTILF